MATYKAVFLDVGGIILQIDWQRPFEFAGVFDPRRRQEMVEAFQGWEHFHLFETGKISSEEFYSGFNAIMGMQRTNEFWHEVWMQIIIGELPEVHQIFDLLKGKVPVYAVSNTNVDHFNFQMKHFPVTKRFDRYFTSFELGERKPDAGFFKKIIEACSVNPHEALFVDDTLENVEAAKRFGFNSRQTVNSVRETLEFLHSNLPQC